MYWTNQTVKGSQTKPQTVKTCANPKRHIQFIKWNYRSYMTNLKKLQPSTVIKFNSSRSIKSRVKKIPNFAKFAINIIIEDSKSWNWPSIYQILEISPRIGMQKGLFLRDWNGLKWQHVIKEIKSGFWLSAESICISSRYTCKSGIC